MVTAPGWLRRFLGVTLPAPVPMPTPVRGPTPRYISARAVTRELRRQEIRPGRRQWSGGFHAGDTNRLTGPWFTVPRSIDEVIYTQLRPMRARSRAECLNNNHARKFLGLVQNNVAGPMGVGMQAQVKLPDGTRDRETSRALEEAWKEWGGCGTADYLGKLTWLEFQHLVLRTMATDGEALVRLVRGREAGPFAFALTILDAELLDVGDCRELPGGGFVRFGVECDASSRVVAYWLNQPAGAALGMSSPYTSRVNRTRVPASEVLHLHLSEHAGQKRGLPWMSAALLKMHTLDDFEEYSLLNAKAGASKGGFYQQDPELTDEDYLGDRQGADGSLEEDIEPLAVRKLPPGYTFQEFNPQYPNGEFGPFMKAGLQSIAAGLGVSYHSLAQDLEGVNYSSMRGGVQEEREGWQVLQEWFVAHFVRPVYQEWLAMALLADAIPGVGIEREVECRRVHWAPRRWDWVDPLKDTTTHKLEYDAGAESLTSWARAKGRDLEQIFEERQAEAELAKSYGLTLPGSSPAASPAAPPPSDAEPDPEDEGEDTEDPAEEEEDARLLAAALNGHRRVLP